MASPIRKTSAPIPPAARRGRSASPGPTEPLATFNGENMQGDWTLTVYDYWSDSIGAIIDWSLLPTPALADACAVCADAADLIFADGFESQ